MNGFVINFLHDMRIKEEFALVMAGDEIAFILATNNWRKLSQVTNQNYLDSPKWFTFFGSIFAKSLVDGIQHVSSDHRYLIYDESLQGAHYCFITSIVIGAIYMFESYVDSKAEEAVDGKAANIYCSNARRCKDNCVFGQNILAQVSKQS
ncbi:unannotated protein [freshwater metagenome]|uniref:Unannotated protein n=1 Tax=freshwater metagenome TaxID=449393 RepID=A0A6J6T3C3_9ZZZZ